MSQLSFMQRSLYLALLLFASQVVPAQENNTYIDSIQLYQKNYVTTHEVVKGKDKKYFRFFPVSSDYNINCRFVKLTDSIGFTMKTSDNSLQHYYKYGELQFTLSGIACRLFVYQSSKLMKTEKYKDYLFVPFTDSTTSDESYGGGRYLEFYIREIKDNSLQLDFNKAYNPYCAYASGYHCPFPPKENNLAVAVRAGEMVFGKKH